MTECQTGEGIERRNWREGELKKNGNANGRQKLDGGGFAERKRERTLGVIIDTAKKGNNK